LQPINSADDVAADGFSRGTREVSPRNRRCARDVQN
jgi:hypothetical protein